MVHSPDDYNDQGWAKPKATRQELHPGLLRRCQGTKHFKPILLYLHCEQAGSISWETNWHPHGMAALQVVTLHIMSQHKPTNVPKTQDQTNPVVGVCTVVWQVKSSHWPGYGLAVAAVWGMHSK